MTRYLFDSNAVTAFVNHREPFLTRVREAQAAGNPMGTCEPIIAELYYGLELSASKATNVLRLEQGLRRLKCWPFDRRAAQEYGRIAAELRRQGRPMQVFDMMLAAVALSTPKGVVVTTDSDLSAIPGLTVENWMTASPAN